MGIIHSLITSLHTPPVIPAKKRTVDDDGSQTWSDDLLGSGSGTILGSVLVAITLIMAGSTSAVGSGFAVNVGLFQFCSMPL